MLCSPDFSRASPLYLGGHTDSLKEPKEYFQTSENHTICPWKGTASYYDIEVDGQVNKNAAWYYPSPKPAAKDISGYVAFWKGIQIEA